MTIDDTLYLFTKSYNIFIIHNLIIQLITKVRQNHKNKRTNLFKKRHNREESFDSSENLSNSLEL